jgi:DNA-binding response OmpR family regulator
MATIFMAEDDPLMITIYSQIFKLNGFDFVMAADGEQAIANLSSMAQKPEIAVLDVMMPKKDGFEVLKFMKADQTLKSIPVIVLTNLSSQEDMKKGLDLGAEACLVKSQNSPEEIAAKTKEVYDKHYPAK